MSAPGRPKREWLPLGGEGAKRQGCTNEPRRVFAPARVRMLLQSTPVAPPSWITSPRIRAHFADSAQLKLEASMR